MAATRLVISASPRSAVQRTHPHPHANGNVNARASSLALTSGFGGTSCSSLFLRGGRVLDISSSRSKRRRRRESVDVKALFGLGVPELVVIAGVTALIFGPKKLPEIGKSLGKTVKSFQQAAKEFETEVKKEGQSSTTELPTSTTEVPMTSSSEVTAKANEKDVQI